MYKLTIWLNKNFLLGFVMVLLTVSANAQIKELSLEKAYHLARENYPLIKQKSLIEKSNFLTLQNIQSNFLPQININAQATYQTDVTSVPISLPNLSIPSLTKDQYKLVADINQLIYDGGTIKLQKEIQQQNSLVDDQKLEVELYKLKDRINQLFLGIILLNEQLQQNKLASENIQIGLKTVSADVLNGTAFRSAQLVLEAQVLQSNQKTIELLSNKKQLIKVLELFLHQSLAEDVQLIKPIVDEKFEAANTFRPEIKLFDYQDTLLAKQFHFINVKNSPKLSLFAQGGYGKPGLNVLKNDFDFFGIGGVRLNWNLSGLYNSKREKQMVTVNQTINNVQKDVFVFNTNTQLVQQQTEIVKIKQLIIVDEKIIEIRKSVTESAKSQLQNGVITSNDYLREVNAEDQSRTTLILHQIQLLQSQINYQTIKGN